MNNFITNPRKSRGLNKLILRVGDITKVIEWRIQQKKRVRLLEVGCGHGVALMDLRQRYGEQVELCGINREPGDGGPEFMREATLDRYPDANAPPLDAPLPRILYFDAGNRWPLLDDSFDIVFSQHAFLWFADKIKALEEINRVLTSDGVAFIDLMIKRTGSTDKHSIVIFDRNREILFWDYIQSFRNIKLAYPQNYLYRRLIYWVCRRVLRIKYPKPTPYWEIRKSKNLCFNLEFVSTTSFSKIKRPRKGWQSIYRVARSEIEGSRENTGMNGLKRASRS